MRILTIYAIIPAQSSVPLPQITFLTQWACYLIKYSYQHDPICTCYFDSRPNNFKARCSSHKFNRCINFPSSTLYSPEYLSRHYKLLLERGRGCIPISIRTGLSTSKCVLDTAGKFSYPHLSQLSARLLCKV